jgi:hypothetical protein
MKICPKRVRMEMRPQKMGMPVNHSLEGAYLGSFAIDVRELTLEWKNSRNRVVDPSQIEKLKTSFKLGIRRFAIEDRFCTYPNLHRISLLQYKGVHPATYLTKIIIVEQPREG